MIERILQPIPDTNNLYGVNPVGEVFGYVKNRYLTPTIDRSGYLRLRLSKNNKKFSKYVHRLVASAYIPNPDNKPFINHKNGNKVDNRISNLEWCSQKENVRHAWANGLAKSRYGENHHNAILTDRQIIDIRSLLQDGLPQTEIAKRFNCSQSLISQIKLNIRKQSCEPR